MKTVLYLIMFWLTFTTCFRQKVINANTEQLPFRGLCAHRGAMETHPENTISAFRAAIEAGAHMIELDVWLTKDSKMVVIHDATVDRTTNGSGKISELTLSEIKKLDAGSWKSPSFKGERVPTFKEALSVMPRNIWLNIHIKGDGDASVLAAQLLKNENRLDQAFLACSAKAAQKAKAKIPSILICNMDRQELNEDYVKNTIAMGADFIQLKGELTPEFPAYARLLKEKGIRINYYGTDSPETIKQLFEYGIDFPLVNDIVHTVTIAEESDLTPLHPKY